MTQVILWCSVLLPTKVFFFFFTHPGKCCKTWHKYSNIFLNWKFSIFTWNWIEWPSAVLISYIDMASGHPLPRKLGIQLSSTVISDKQKSAQLISLEKPLAVLWWSAYRTACGKWQNSAWKHVACLLKIVHSFSSAYPSCHRAKDEVHPGVVDRLLQERHAHIHSYGQLRITN